jgi:hypothetical protein
MTMMTVCGRSVRAALAGVALLLVLTPGSARAQPPAADDPNPGALTFTGGVDVPSVYVFRGLLQELDPKITMWPYGDLGITLASGDGGVKSVGVNVGVWNSLNTGSSGTDGPSGHAHYEEDFYTTLNLGFGGGVGVGLTYMALTSPNNMFNTVKEFQIKVAKAGMLNPYGFLASELTDKSADGGENKGTYLELGVGPSFPLGGSASLAVPVKLGISVKDYYELNGEDRKFGWFDVGALITVPLGVPSRFGAWNLHGGADVIAMGDTPKAFNEGKSSKVVGLVGIGVTY